MPFYRKRRSRRSFGQQQASIREGEADGGIIIRMGLLRRLGSYRLSTASSTSVLQIPVFTLVSSSQIPHSSIDSVAQGQRSTPYIPSKTPLRVRQPTTNHQTQRHLIPVKLCRTRFTYHNGQHLTQCVTGTSTTTPAST